MKFTFALLSILLTSLSHGTPFDRVIYYSGVEVRTSLFGEPQVVEDLLLVKSLLPSKGVMIEIACTKIEDNAAETYPVYMAINGDKIEKISDSENYTSDILTGSGKLEGQSWDWNYLTFSMNYKMPKGITRIQDENWVSGKHLIAIKEVYWNAYDGSPEIKVGIITAKVHEIDKTTYDLRRQEMGCPSK
jgi:hypothetical protein